jgi:hypothetical protein
LCQNAYQRLQNAHKPIKTDKKITPQIERGDENFFALED